MDMGFWTGTIHSTAGTKEPLTSSEAKRDICKLLFNIWENRHAYILIFVEVGGFEGGVPSDRPPAANQFAPIRKAGEEFYD